MPPPHRAAARRRPHVVTGGPQPCSAATYGAPSEGGFTADQIAAAYGYSGLYQSGDEGAGQTVAILELEPYELSDIQAYGACYGVNPLIDPNIPVDGGAGSSGPGSGEAALDIENVIGLAPKANIAVYEGPNSGQRPVRHDERDHQPASGAGGHHVVGAVRAGRGLRPAQRREHAVPGGGHGGNFGPVGVGR